MSARSLIKIIEAKGFCAEDERTLKDFIEWQHLKLLINEAIPEMQPVVRGGKYKFSTPKKGTRTVEATKENGKSWIMYEVTGSRSPGCRWTIPKSRCGKDELERVTCDETIPSGVRIY